MRLITRFEKSLPLSNRRNQALPMCDSGGIKTESKVRPAISQRIASVTIEMTLILNRLFNGHSPSPS